MKDFEPAQVANADQVSASVREAIGELLGSVALMRHFAAAELEEETKAAIDAFMQVAQSIPPNLSVAVMFDLCKRLIDGNTVTVNVIEEPGL